MAGNTAPLRSPGDFQAMEKRLKIFRTAGEAHRENLDELMSYCETLIEDVQLLKTERDNNKQDLPRSPASSEVQQSQQIQNDETAYVAILIDGNDYLFKEEYIKGQYTGGVAAGEQLFYSTTQHLPEGWKGGDVIACVYADLDRVSNQESSTGNTTSQKTEIMDFFNGWTASFSSFDFINTGRSDGSTVAKLSRKSAAALGEVIELMSVKANFVFVSMTRTASMYSSQLAMTRNTSQCSKSLAKTSLVCLS